MQQNSYNNDRCWADVAIILSEVCTNVDFCGLDLLKNTKNLIVLASIICVYY